MGRLFNDMYLVITNIAYGIHLELYGIFSFDIALFQSSYHLKCKPIEILERNANLLTFFERNAFQFGVNAIRNEYYFNGFFFISTRVNVAMSYVIYSFRYIPSISICL